MPEPTGRIPEGEPSVKNVLAALVRARKTALARAEAVRRREVVDGATSEGGEARVRGEVEGRTVEVIAGAGAGGRADS